MANTEAQTRFIEVFKELCYGRSSWQVWNDMVLAVACSISNAVDRSKEVWDKREKEYAACVERMGSVEDVAKLYAEIVNALDAEPEQDFLGNLFMQLGLGSNWLGQFFTPYSVARAMADLTFKDADKLIKEKGFISVVDPSCGAGVTLIAGANAIRKQRPDFQNHVLFAGQDIDRMAGLMCYIQMSLLGFAGYVCIADTLVNPLTSENALFPQEKEGQEIWYTPMYFSEVWHLRRLCHGMDYICRNKERRIL